MLLILILVAALYSHVFRNLLTNWDDSLYVLYNPYLKSLSFENLKNIFTNFFAGNYHPLTLISMSLDYQIGGTQPWPYQLTNLILHLANTLLVFILVKSLLRLHLPGDKKYNIAPFVAALLFGIHTLQVESVAWISERKNVLYTFFFLTSIIVYIKYLKNNSYKTYITSIALFILSLLSKGMAIPLPICIIAIDFLAGRNQLSKKVILEKVPYLLLSIVFGIIAILAQHSGEALRIENFSVLERIAVAGYGFILYLLKLVFPYQLSAYYPYPSRNGAFLSFQYYIALVVILVLLFVLARYLRKNKIVLFASLFFIANISIVIQLLPIGDAFMAERYVYIPSIAFFFVFGYYCNELMHKSIVNKISIITALLIYSTILAIKTYDRIGLWHDSLTLWNNSLKNYPENNDRGYLNRGNILFEMGKHTEAFQDYDKLLKIDFHNSGGYIGMARIKQASGDIEGAMRDFNTALLLKKTYEGYIDRAVLKITLKDFEGALADLDKAYTINPSRTGVYINKGFIFYKQSNYSGALLYYNLALQVDPKNSNAYLGRGHVKQALNDMHGALNDFNAALLFKQSYEGYISRAILKIAINDLEGAGTDLDVASQIAPFGLEILFNRGIIELKKGNTENALFDFNQVIEINSNDFIALNYRAIARIGLADYKGAIEDLDRSIQLQPNADAYYHRGIAKNYLKQKKAGCKDLQQAASMGYISAKQHMQQHCK